MVEVIIRNEDTQHSREKIRKIMIGNKRKKEIPDFKISRGQLLSITANISVIDQSRKPYHFSHCMV